MPELLIGNLTDELNRNLSRTTYVEEDFGDALRMWRVELPDGYVLPRMVPVSGWVPKNLLH
jgi:hypothetical protein